MSDLILYVFAGIGFFRVIEISVLIVKHWKKVLNK